MYRYVTSNFFAITSSTLCTVGIHVLSFLQKMELFGLGSILPNTVRFLSKVVMNSEEWWEFSFSHILPTPDSVTLEYSWQPSFIWDCSCYLQFPITSEVEHFYSVVSCPLVFILLWISHSWLAFFVCSLCF